MKKLIHLLLACAFASSAFATTSPVGSVGVAQKLDGITFSYLNLDGGQALIVHPDVDSGSSWQFTSGLTPLATTTSTLAQAAQGVGLRSYVTDFTFFNTSATVSTTVTILDGATVIWTGYLPATTATLPIEEVHVTGMRTALRGTANTQLNVQLGTTGAAVYYNLTGYKAP
jgi:hypothetical protein